MHRALQLAVETFDCRVVKDCQLLETTRLKVRGIRIVLEMHGLQKIRHPDWQCANLPKIVIDSDHHP